LSQRRTTRPPRTDLTGVPGWLAASLNFCSRCGEPLVLGPLDTETRDRLVCHNCGFIAYVNPRVVVSTLPVTEDGDVVLIRRAIEPGYGAWAQPGGFLEIDETAQEGAIRETLEETGLVVEPTQIVGVYSRPQAAVVVVVWEARIVGGKAVPTAESLEVKAYAPPEIPWPRIAFQTTAWALRDWISQRHPQLQTAPGRQAGQWPLDSA
jgi:ADP-ribose pyrophosphatase YjhB (NUDIX family)